MTCRRDLAVLQTDRDPHPDRSRDAAL